jgi:hypothetical protein
MTIITETIQVNIKQEKIVEVICNSCKKCMSFDKDNPEFIEGVELVGEFGYGSERDSEKHIMHLCDECYKKMLDIMNIEPVID